MKGKWKKLFLILLLPFLIFIEGCSCGSMGNVDKKPGYPFRVHFYMGYEGSDGYYPLQIDFQEVPGGGTVTKPEDPVWEKHSFEGWYKDQECTEPWNFAYDVVESEMTLYAKWLGKFKVKFNLNSINCVPQYIHDVEVVKGKKIEEPTKPTLKNYTFEGWFVDELFTDEWIFDTDVVERDLTLYAKWKKNK